MKDKYLTIQKLIDILNKCSDKDVSPVQFKYKNKFLKIGRISAWEFSADIEIELTDGKELDFGLLKRSALKEMEEILKDTK